MTEIKPVAWRYRAPPSQPMVKAKARHDDWLLTQHEADASYLEQMRSEVEPLYTEAQVKAREAAAWEAGREASAGAVEEGVALLSVYRRTNSLDKATAAGIRLLDNPHKGDA